MVEEKWQVCIWKTISAITRHCKTNTKCRHMIKTTSLSSPSSPPFIINSKKYIPSITA
jgi:hypothetical protein